MSLFGDCAVKRAPVARQPAAAPRGIQVHQPAATSSHAEVDAEIALALRYMYVTSLVISLSPASTYRYARTYGTAVVRRSFGTQLLLPGWALVDRPSDGWAGQEDSKMPDCAMLLVDRTPGACTAVQY